MLELRYLVRTSMGEKDAGVMKTFLLSLAARKLYPLTSLRRFVLELGCSLNEVIFLSLTTYIGLVHHIV